MANDQIKMFSPKRIRTTESGLKKLERSFESEPTRLGKESIADLGFGGQPGTSNCLAVTTRLGREPDLAPIGFDLLARTRSHTCLSSRSAPP